MSTIVVQAFITLDGVVQGGGAPDEDRFAVYPLMLGTGKRLFSDSFTLSRFTLADSRALQSGVVVNSYRRPA